MTPRAIPVERDPHAYRRLAGSDRWHLCRSCPEWPLERFFVERHERPGGAYFCVTCLDLCRGASCPDCADA